MVYEFFLDRLLRFKGGHIYFAEKGSMDMDFLKRCWAEISLENVKYNYERYKSFLGEETSVMCVVKASCYGHGDQIIVPFLQNELGVKYFAVSNLTEAQKLRKMGINGEILILGYTPPEMADELVNYNIIQACTELSYAKRLSKACKNAKVRLHAAVDTGMGRIGFCGTAFEICQQICQANELENVIVEGIFTHFASADETSSESCEYTKMQCKKFFETAQLIERQGVKLRHIHSLNSAGGIYYYGGANTLSRLGIILYGLSPNPDKPLPFEPKPVMSLKAAVSQVKVVEKGSFISYGRTFCTPNKMKIATITAGYADGYPRSLSNKGEVIVNGVKCPIVGRICMDQFMCDVTDAGNVKSGDTAVLIGEQGGCKITADDIAQIDKTINYEIVCGISSRVPRVKI